MLQSFKDFIARVWDQRFLFGPELSVLEVGCNRFMGGQHLFKIALLQLSSPGTGHWPFYVFQWVKQTGERACWHVTILGLCVGTIWLPDLKEDGSLAGPDYRKLYFMFNCINHKGKQLEEII